MTELSNFWNPNSKKLKARKANANKMKKRGVKIPTGNDANNFINFELPTNSLFGSLKIIIIIA